MASRTQRETAAAPVFSFDAPAAKQTFQTGDAPELFEFMPARRETVQSRHGFSSPEALAAWLASPAAAAPWADYGTSWEMDGAWYGELDLPRAITMALNGWQDGADRVARLRDLINTRNPNSPRMVRHDVAGAIPCVARAIAGNPLNMRRIDSARARRRPVLTLISHYGAAQSVGARSMVRRAAVVAALVDAIETAGFSSHVIAYTVAEKNDVAASTAVTVKEAGAPLDVARVAFGLGHPAMLRRLTFALRCARHECKPFGTGMGATDYAAKLTPGANAAGAYLLPAITALGEECFASDAATVARGLPAMVRALAQQGCPAFPQEAAAA